MAGYPNLLTINPLLVINLELQPLLPEDDIIKPKKSKAEKRAERQTSEYKEKQLAKRAVIAVARIERKKAKAEFKKEQALKASIPPPIRIRLCIGNSDGIIYLLRDVEDKVPFTIHFPFFIEEILSESIIDIPKLDSMEGLILPIDLPEPKLKLLQIVANKSVLLISRKVETTNCWEVNGTFGSETSKLKYKERFIIFTEELRQLVKFILGHLTYKDGLRAAEFLYERII
jgi:hypothetical protein